MTNAYMYSPKAVHEPGTNRSAARCLNQSETQCSSFYVRCIDEQTEPHNLYHINDIDLYTKY